MDRFTMNTPDPVSTKNNPYIKSNKKRRREGEEERRKEEQRREGGGEEKEGEGKGEKVYLGSLLRALHSFEMLNICPIDITF